MTGTKRGGRKAGSASKGRARTEQVVADPNQQIAVAVSATLKSLQHLTETCRKHGVDPMTTILSVMANLRGATAAPATTNAPSAWTATHVEIIRRSCDLVDALDRGELDAVEQVVAPGFIHIAGKNVTDRETTIARIKNRPPNSPYFASRTWSHESVTPNGDSVVFNGRAHEVQGGNDSHGGYVNDGWYTLQWTCVDTLWRARVLVWQRDTSDRDWWNDTFTTGRGFSHEPNRLLVESVRSVQAGRALDLASGQGRNALYLAEQGWQVVGVDLSDEGLRIARNQATKRNLTIATLNVDIDEWDFGVEEFDLVTLLYAGDDGRWIEKIKRSLRLGGMLVLEGWAKTSPHDPGGFEQGQLATLFADYEVLRDECVEDAPDWARDKGVLVRFVARKIRVESNQ